MPMESSKTEKQREERLKSLPHPHPQIPKDHRTAAPGVVSLPWEPEGGEGEERKK